MEERLELVVSPIPEMPKLISNIDELKEQLEVSLKKYQNLVVTEDGIKDAERDRANLNKLKKVIADERIRQKRIFYSPFEEFETKCKNVEKMVDETAKAIDTQVKAFADREKEAKRLEIQALYDQNIGPYAKLIPLEKIWDDRWLNKTYKLRDIGNMISATRISADLHLRQVHELNSEFEEQLKNKYFETLDISAVLAENTRLAQQKKLMEELKEKELLRKAEEALVEEAEAEFKAQNEPVAIGQIKAEEPELITIAFRVSCTREQLKALGEYMKANGIKYGRA